jgi:hypothetical protein
MSLPITRARRLMLLAALIVAAAMPVAAWAFVKHVRIIAPELNGVSCVGAVCVERMSTLPFAQQLHAQAMDNIAAKLRPLDKPPRAVFCSTPACYQSFGGGRERGAAIGNLGVIIPPQSWQIYIVEHELLHMLQSQELGLIGRERTPPWFKEGMPFHISAPPDFDLPDYARPLVDQYQAWEQRVGRDNVWTEIGRR